MAKVMIVGGAGYVGTSLSAELYRRKHDVTVVDLMWFGNHLIDPLKPKAMVRDAFDLTQKDMEGFDAVVFVAGLSNDPMADYSPSKNFISNSASPSYISYIAKKAGVKRMVYASSCSVYGYAVDEFYDESGPTVAVFPYGISKLQGEKSVMQMADDDFSVIALRKGTISGVSPRMRFDLVVNAMFKSAMTTGTITVNNPEIWRPILSMSDCVSAYTLSVEANHEVSGVFNIASGNHKVGEIASLVKAKIDSMLGTDIKIVTNNVKDVRNYKVTYQKASEVLGYNPACDVGCITAGLVESRNLFGNMDDPMYHNIKSFIEMEGKK
jgi:nucleoside-diphosphate-sugar epimerase